MMTKERHNQLTETINDDRYMMLRPAYGIISECLCEIERLQAEVERLQQHEAWTTDLPTEMGSYWWWNGDEDSTPIHIEIFYSATSRSCFAPSGQYGWNRAQDVSEMGGWWKKLPTPDPPDCDETDAAMNCEGGGK